MSTRTVNTVRTLGPVRDYPAHVGEPEAQALHRLAARAHEKGIRLIVNQVTNHHFCTSASNRDKLHAVTLLSCDCRGFITHGRCMHFALVLERYGCLPAIVPDPSPDGGGAALPVPAAPIHVNCGVIEDGAYLRRGSALGILDDRQKAALVKLDREAGIVVDVPIAEDVVVSVVAARAPRRRATIRVENPHTVTKPSPVTRGATVSWVEADGVEVDGRMHGVGDQVVYVLNQGRGWTDVGTIQSIYRTTEHGRWKVVIRETGYGRYVADLRAVRSEEVRHVA